MAVGPSPEASPRLLVLRFPTRVDGCTFNQGAAVNEDQVEGNIKQAEGEAQESWGDAKDKVGDAIDDVKDKAGDLKDKVDDMLDRDTFEETKYENRPTG